MAQLSTLGHFTPHKIMFNKSDIRFEEMAADPARRRAAIADLSMRRTVIFWCAAVISVCAVASSWSGKSSDLIFSAAVSVSILFKFESDLRLLRTIDRLQKGSDEKPVA